MQSVMTHNFARNATINIPRSSFDRSHGYKTTFDAGLLIPIYTDEALPGDTFNLRLSTFARLATPISPIMDNMRMDVHFFAVPNRLLWDKWEEFNGAIDHADFNNYLPEPCPNSTSPDSTGYAIGSLEDYFGIPTGVPKLTHTLWFHRAYQKIYNEWYLDQNLQDKLPEHNGSGTIAELNDYKIRPRGKRHDYFTSCLPWPQKNFGPEVRIPIGHTAPVVASSDQMKFSSVPLGGGNPAEFYANPNDPGGGPLYAPHIPSGSSINNQPAYWGDQTGLQADLSSATSATINELREAFAWQKIFEKDARGGTRYTEILRSHFSVVSPDQRVQRPEYLGKFTQPINIHPIAQTSETASGGTGTPQGNLAAIGTSGGSQHVFTKSFVEHCVILGIASVRADLTYQQGLDKKFSRYERFDYYWPSLQSIGEQPVFNKEIYAQGEGVTSSLPNVSFVDDEVFGYQEAWASYRYFPSKITGKFRSSDPQTLDHWHLSENFAQLPKLNAEFISEEPPVDRVIAVQSEPHFLLDAFFNIKCVRPMPVYSIPGNIDHF